ncbi:hydroxyacylglutathione hydrolase [Marinomonas epiphytica]
MTLLPLPAFNDNYIWLIKDNDSSGVWVVDPGDAAPVFDYCQQHSSPLLGILITHHHFDHTGGVAELKSHFDCPVFGPAHLKKLITHPVKDGDQIPLFNHTFHVMATPAHTLDHLCYYSDQAQPILLSGDTLFKGGCGRLMEGTAEQMLDALTKLAALPDHCLVYCTHEYTLANYRFALSIDPDNQQLITANQQAEQLRAEQAITLPSNMALEKATNPFLRTAQEKIISLAAQQLNEPPAQTPKEAFSQVRRAKDSFS